jgi:hypothetical protein
MFVIGWYGKKEISTKCFAKLPAFGFSGELIPGRL